MKVVNNSFTGGRIIKYSEINVVCKFLDRQKVSQKLNKLFPTICYNSTKFGTFHFLQTEPLFIKLQIF